MFARLTLRRGCLLGAALALTACASDVSVAGPTDPPDEDSTDDAVGPDDESVPENTGNKAMDAGVTLVPSTDGGAPPTEVVQDASAPSARPAATSFSYAVTTEPHADDQPIFNITRPADMAQVDGPLPVIVWANGGCFRTDFTWAPLFKRWAEAGFVVLSLFSGSEDQGLVGLISMLGTTTKTEHAKLIDWVVAQNKSGPYAGKLDLERIVVAGNSCGGVTALQVASTDERAAAVFVLSGSSALGSVDETIMQGVKVPVGYVVGGEEDIAGANATGDYDAMNEGLPAMIVSRREGDHQTVSTDEKILPEDAEIALNWMDLALYGTKTAYDALSSPNVCDQCTPGDWTLKSKHLDTLLK